MNSVIVRVNNRKIWANMREFDDGLRLRLTLDDWRQLNFDRDQRIRVGVHKQSGVWLRVTDVRECPPNVVLTLTNGIFKQERVRRDAAELATGF